MTAHSQYQERDKDVADYHLYDFPGVSVKLRGPRNDLIKSRYIACLGAAQTFGPLCNSPWPALLRENGEATLNLGFGGAGPSFFLLNPKLIELTNKASIAIVQVTAARSTRNSYLDIRGGRSNARPRVSKEEFITTEFAYQQMLEAIGPRMTKLIVQETRQNWVFEMELLLEAIRVPTILFWFSERTPEYQEEYKSARTIMGKFPQLINRAMIDQIRPRAVGYAECISSRGLPQTLLNKTTGEPTKIALGNDKQLREFNTYYPSPEMHHDAFASLAPVISTLKSRMRQLADQLGDQKKNASASTRS